ncbi:fimbria/pilus outer membrane usher protein [Burkholderia cenocepacia]|uniref:fimbria/pilus outer membrane usher protein n=1 Tax=Burkholderia cenocepacia TaxID=95486 RepID=UPI002AB5E424|nr:fimbria/pilus outer membrane usher protein [Burkholderia cenocepacia]MDI9648665.1 fimbria/pilus outer membrane usher protein [Burkholderia cenocepacia]
MAAVTHRRDIMLSRPSSETFAIVEANHARGARVTNAVCGSGNGYTIVPSLTPFSLNDVCSNRTACRGLRI